MTYESVAVVESRVASGVSFMVARMSFGRRVELMRRVRERAGRVEFLEAGADAGAKMDAGVLRAEIDRLYLVWGLRSVAGLQVEEWRRRPRCWRIADPRNCFERRWLRCGHTPEWTTLNEKTDCRLPLFIRQPDRLGVRHVPESRAGKQA